MRTSPFSRVATASALVVTFAGLAWVWASTAGATNVLKCGRKTIPVSITGTIPLTYIDITVSGVSCSYAEKVFLIDTSKAGAAPPKGWNIKITAGANDTFEDTCTRGTQWITFRFLKKT